MTSDSQLVCAYESLGRAPGTAPTLVLSHSLGADRGMWRPQLDALAADYHLLLIDTRGHGRSRVPPGPYTLDMLTQDVLAVLDAADIERFHFCGISMGGMIGLMLALRAPTRVRSLVACNTGARIGTEASWQARIEAVEHAGMRGIRDAVLARWYGQDFAQKQPTLHAAIEQTFCSTDPAGYIGCCQALATADLRSEIASIRTPTLIVGGTHDLSTPPELAHWLHAQIAGSELTIFEGAAHLSNLDRPDEFSTCLCRFLRAR